MRRPPRQPERECGRDAEPCGCTGPRARASRRRARGALWRGRDACCCVAKPGPVDGRGAKSGRCPSVVDGALAAVGEGARACGGLVNPFVCALVCAFACVCLRASVHAHARKSSQRAHMCARRCRSERACLCVSDGYPGACRPTCVERSGSTYTHTHALTEARTHANTHTHTHAHARTRTRTCARARARTHTSTEKHSRSHTRRAGTHRPIGALNA
jgi:hypothetical protein